MNIKKLLPAGLIALVWALFLVSASSAITISVDPNQDYVGSSDAHAEIIYVNVSTSKWKAQIKSYMADPPTSINILGRTSWTVREYCWPDWTQNFQYGGDTISGSSYLKTKEVTKEPCSGDRLGRSMGQHDFHHDGVDRWRSINDNPNLYVTLP